MRAIFISYRRDDTEGQAGRLFDELVREFGAESVFMDVATIEPGRDFRRVIDEHVASCGVLLCVIGKGWLEARDANGRRLDDPMDFVRLETAAALRRDIPVIPVLVHGATMPRAEDLPDDLKELAFRNGIQLTHAHWETDLGVLIKALRRQIEPKATPAAAPAPVAAAPVASAPAAPTAAPAASPRRSAPLIAAGVALAAAAAYLSMGGQPAPAEAEAGATKPLAQQPAQAPISTPAPAPASAATTVAAAPAMPPSPQPTAPAAAPKPAPTAKPATKPKPAPAPDPVVVEPTPEPAAPVQVNLVGRWTNADCPLFITRDTGKRIEGDCDNSIRHHLEGTYVSAREIAVKVTRIDTKGCSTTMNTRIRVLDDSTIENRNEGWNGCGVQTPPSTTRHQRR